MTTSQKCAACNNVTKNPSGRCHLHENAVSSDSAAGRSLSPAPALSLGSDTPDGITAEVLYDPQIGAVVTITTNDFTLTPCETEPHSPRALQFKDQTTDDYAEPYYFVDEDGDEVPLSEFTLAEYKDIVQTTEAAFESDEYRALTGQPSNEEKLIQASDDLRSFSPKPVPGQAGQWSIRNVAHNGLEGSDAKFKRVRDGARGFQATGNWDQITSIAVDHTGNSDIRSLTEDDYLASMN